MDENERRRFLREQAAFVIVYRVKGPLSVRSEFGEVEREAIASNLCEGGLSLFTNDEFPVGTLLTLKFRLISSIGSTPDERSRKMELQGEVRHSAKAMMKHTFISGVEFRGLSESDRNFIKNVTSA